MTTQTIMDMDNKTRFKSFIKAAKIFLCASIAIGTTSTALNSFPGTFLSVVAVLNLAVVGVCIYELAKGHPTDKEDKE